MKTAIYARVSTADQSHAMQQREMEEDCARRQWEPILFSDEASGAKANRPGLQVLMAAVRSGKVGAVMVWKFDRFARSLRQLLDALEEFRARGVEFVSLHDQIDTSTPQGRLVFSLIGAIAEFERELIRERVLAGVAYARKHGTRSGKAIGRPKRIVDKLTVIQLRSEGKSWAQISAMLKVGRGTLQRVAVR